MESVTHSIWYQINLGFRLSPSDVGTLNYEIMVWHPYLPSAFSKLLDFIPVLRGLRSYDDAGSADGEMEARS